MLQVLSPPAPAVAPTSSFEELDSCSNNSTAAAAAVTDVFGSSSQQGVATAAKAAGVTTSEYCDQLDIANFFLEMAATRPFSLQDETAAAAGTTTAAAADISSTLPPASTAMTASSDTSVPKITGGRILTTTATIDSEITPSPPLASPGLPPLPATPGLPPKNEHSQAFSPPPPPPPPPSDRDLYEKRPLPALPGGPQPSGAKRHSGSSTLSRELKAAFATPHQRGSFFEGGEDDSQPGSQSQPQQEQQEHPGGGVSAAASDDMSDWEETEIRMVLDRSTQHPAARDVRFRGVSSSQSPSRHNYQQSETSSPQPKLSMQKLLRLTGGGSKPSHTTNTSHPVVPGGGGGSSGASSMPSGHNSMHKIKQLMGVDVAPRESSSSEFLRRARWSHQDDDVFASDQEIEISEGCFLDSDDDSEEDVPVPTVAPTSAPTTKTERRNRFENDNNSREESPVPAPLFISKNHRDLLLDADDLVVRPSSSAGERRLGLASSHQYNYPSSSSLHYKEDLYHRTTVQLSRAHNTTTTTSTAPSKNNNWRNSGSSVTGLSPPTTRESHGRSSFGSNSLLIKPSNIDPDKPLPSPPPTASGAGSSKVPDTPTTWSSSPGLPSGRSLASPEPTPTTTPQPQPQQRKRATSTGAFGNIVNQKWQNWQSQHRQLTSSGQSAQQTKGGPKVRIPYDPATDPHPGIRIILPYEVEEEEFPVSSPTKSQHRASIVSSLLKRISGSASTTPTSPAHGHKKRPSEPTTPTWLTNSGLISPGVTATPTSSPIGGIPPPLALLDTLSLPPIVQKVVSPTSAAAATIPISTPEKLAGATLEVPPVSPPPPSISPKSRPPAPVLQSSIITKTSMFGLTEQHQLQTQPQTPSRLPIPTQREQLPGNQRSSFSISEPPSPILGGLASLGHLNLSSGALGLGSFTSKARDSDRDRDRDREYRGESSSKRSVSSLGFRSPDKLNLQWQLGPGLRAVADRSTLIAQRTNELVGQVSKSLMGKTVKSVGKTKRLGSINLKAGDKNSDSKPSNDNKKEKEKDKGTGQDEEKWKEDIKSKIRVLDDGGRVLGGGGGGHETGPEGSGSTTNLLIPLALASPLLPISMTHGAKPIPERPERSPTLPGTENEGWLSSNTGVQETEGEGVIEGPSGTSTSTESDSTGQEPGNGTGTGTGATGRSTAVPITALRSPPPAPPVPPRSKNRPISGVGFGFNTNNSQGMMGVSALGSIGFGSNGDGNGSGSRPGSRPGSSRGILREAFASNITGTGTGGAPGSVHGGSRPGSRGQVITIASSREGLGSRDGRDRPGTPRDGAFTTSGREGTEELETWV